MMLLKVTVDLLNSFTDNKALVNDKRKKHMDEAIGWISGPSESVDIPEVQEETKPHVVRAPVQFLGEKPQIIKQKIGYYVERKHFGTKLAQAEGFAKNRSEIFGRTVQIKYIAHDGVESIVDTIGVNL